MKLSGPFGLWVTGPFSISYMAPVSGPISCLFCASFSVSLALFALFACSVDFLIYRYSLSHCIKEKHGLGLMKIITRSIIAYVCDCGVSP